MCGGGEAGAENNAFFNPSCVSGDKAKGCQLADPLTLAAKTPPAGCTLYLDDGTTPCSMWIKGCSPGQREAPQKGSLVWKDAAEKIAGAADDAASELIRDDGTVLARIPMAGGTAFLLTGQHYFTATNCTGPALIPGSKSFVKAVVVTNPSGPVEYAPDAGTSPNFGSVLTTAQHFVSPGDCSLYVGPGTTFIAPNGCCDATGGNAPLSTPVTVDFTGVTFPLVPAIE